MRGRRRHRKKRLAHLVLRWLNLPEASGMVAAAIARRIAPCDTDPPLPPAAQRALDLFVASWHQRAIAGVLGEKAAHAANMAVLGVEKPQERRSCPEPPRQTCGVCKR